MENKELKDRLLLNKDVKALEDDDLLNVSGGYGSSGPPNSPCHKGGHHEWQDVGSGIFICSKCKICIEWNQ